MTHVSEHVDRGCGGVRLFVSVCVRSLGHQKKVDGCLDRHTTHTHTHTHTNKPAPQNALEGRDGGVGDKVPDDLGPRVVVRHVHVELRGDPPYFVEARA